MLKRKRRINYCYSSPFLMRSYDIFMSNSCESYNSSCNCISSVILSIIVNRVNLLSMLQTVGINTLLHHPVGFLCHKQKQYRRNENQKESQFTEWKML